MGNDCFWCGSDKRCSSLCANGGVPAKQIGWVCECGVPLKDNLNCSECEREYTLENNDLKEK